MLVRVLALDSTLKLELASVDSKTSSSLSCSAARRDLFSRGMRNGSGVARQPLVHRGRLMLPDQKRISKMGKTACRSSCDFVRRMQG